MTGFPIEYSSDIPAPNKELEALRQQLHREAVASNQNESIWNNQSKSGFNKLDGYLRTWVDTDECKKTIDNDCKNYPKIKTDTPEKDVVKRLCDINKPTKDPYITQLTDAELNANTRELSKEALKYNKDNYAPSPQIFVRGVPVIVSVVVKKSNHTTYLYDKDGRVVKSYKNAVGKLGKDKKTGESTETPVGVRYITGITKSPYLGIDDTKKSIEKPEEYGPYIIKLREVDARTGNTENSGVFLHGTKPEWNRALGTHASHGCVRHHNQVITEIVNSGLVNSGTFVNIID